MPASTKPGRKTKSIVAKKELLSAVRNAFFLRLREVRETFARMVDRSGAIPVDLSGPATLFDRLDMNITGT